MSGLKILILENIDNSNTHIIEVLKDNGFFIKTCKNENDFLENIYNEHYDLYLILINEDSLARFQLIKILDDYYDLTLKMVISSIPSLIKQSFVYGCDECVIKSSVDEKEIVLRIRALVRRQYRVYNDLISISKNIKYDIFNKKLYKDDKEIVLGEKALLILDYLLKFRGLFVSSEKLENGVYPANSKSKNGSLRFHIHKIRQLVGKDIIISNRTNGYKIDFNY